MRVSLPRRSGGSATAPPDHEDRRLEQEVQRQAEDPRAHQVAARCRDRYGVVVRDGLDVDVAATEALRRELAARRLWLAAVATERSAYLDGAVSTRRICPLSPLDAGRAGFGEGVIVELLGPSGAPLRAWVVVDGTVAAGTVPLDDLGRRVLGVVPGAPLQVRPL